MYLMKLIQDKLLAKSKIETEKSFLQSGANAEQALNCIKVVKAFGQEDSEYRKFKKHLEQGKKDTRYYSWIYGISNGVLETTYYFGPAFALFIGGILLTSGVSFI